MEDIEQPCAVADSPVPVFDRRVMGWEQFDASIVGCLGRTTPISPDRFPWTTSSLQVGNMSLQISSEGGSNTYEGEVPDGLVGMVVGLPGPAAIRYAGFALSRGRLVVARAGDVVTSFSPGVTRYGMLFLPVARFVELVEQFDPARTERLMYGSPFLDVEIAHWQRIVDLLDVACNAMWPASAASQRVLVEDFTSAFVGAVADSSLSPKAMRKNRGLPLWRNVIAHVREYINAPLRFSYSVKEMARYAGVSERTLRDVVGAAFGVSPKQLILLRQLRDIRVALRQAEAEDTVAAIAARYGVWEFGRFAGRYRSVYGETPSETLADSRRESGSLTQA